MCGRFCLNVEAATLVQHFSLTHNVVLTPRYNIAPTQLIPVIRTQGKLDFMTWGLRPVWLKTEQNSFVNARMETLNERPAFKVAFKQRRCLVVANGYYEWKQVDNIKQPYFIQLPEAKLFTFAAVWDTDTCAIITKPAQQAELLAIHARMPVTISPEHYDLWLNPKTDLAILKNIMQLNNNVFSAFPVSTKANNPKNDFVECTKSLQ